MTSRTDVMIIHEIYLPMQAIRGVISAATDRSACLATWFEWTLLLRKLPEVIDECIQIWKSVKNETWDYTFRTKLGISLSNWVLRNDNDVYMKHNEGKQRGHSWFIPSINKLFGEMVWYSICNGNDTTSFFKCFIISPKASDQWITGREPREIHLPLGAIV